MPRINDVINIFFSSTNDAAAVRRKQIFDKVCSRVCLSNEVAPNILFWKDNIPGGISGKSGQERINVKVDGAFDIYFGCLGTKFGSGTLEEFEHALEGHLKKGIPSEILFAFDSTPVNPYEISDDFARVIAFKKSIETSDRYGASLLYFMFGSEDELESGLFRDMDAAIKKCKNPIRGGHIPLT